MKLRISEHAGELRIHREQWLGAVLMSVFFLFAALGLPLALVLDTLYGDGGTLSQLTSLRGLNFLIVIAGAMLLAVLGIGSLTQLHTRVEIRLSREAGTGEWLTWNLLGRRRVHGRFEFGPNPTLRLRRERSVTLFGYVLLVDRDGVEHNLTGGLITVQLRSDSTSRLCTALQRYLRLPVRELEIEDRASNLAKPAMPMRSKPHAPSSEPIYRAPEPAFKRRRSYSRAERKRAREGAVAGSKRPAIARAPSPPASRSERVRSPAAPEPETGIAARIFGGVFGLFLSLVALGIGGNLIKATFTGGIRTGRWWVWFEQQPVSFLVCYLGNAVALLLCAGLAYGGFKMMLGGGEDRRR